LIATTLFVEPFGPGWRIHHVVELAGETIAT
jgi:hypothetical protein